MKKLISFILAAATVLTILPASAFAAEAGETEQTQVTEVTENAEEAETPEETEAQDETDSAKAEGTEETEEDKLILSARLFTIPDGYIIETEISEKYVSFGDSITITVSSDEECTDILGVFTKEDMVCEVETRYGCSRPVIYIPCSVERKSFYVTVSENSVYDSEGNGNKAETKHGMGTCVYCSPEFSNGRLTYSVGESVTYSLNYPVDFYLNGNLAAENVTEYTVNIDSKGTYTVTAVRHGLTLYKDEFNTEAAKEEAKDTLKEETAELIKAVPMGIAVFLASPLLMVFPPLGAAGLAVPYYGIKVIFQIISDYFKVIFR